MRHAPWLALLSCIVLAPSCECGEPGGDDKEGGETTAPPELRPVLGALCDYIERCPDDIVPMETQSRDECIDVMYFFLSCRIDSEGQTLTLERVDVTLTPEQLAACTGFFQDLGCGALACEDAEACSDDPRRLSCEPLFGGLGEEDDDDDDNGNDSNFDGYDDGVCITHEQCPGGTFCQLPRYSEDDEQTLCSRCVAPRQQGELCDAYGNGGNVVVPCEEGLACGPNWDSGEPSTCTPPRGEGEGCLYDTDCSGGFCVPAIARCHDGGFENDPCDDPRKCREGLVCVEETCVVPTPVGAPCTSNSECENGYCYMTQVCGIPDGEACQDFVPERCQSGFCNPTTLVCGERPPPLGEDEPCTAQWECELGLLCDGTCYASCSSDDDCPGELCDYNTGRCIPRRPNGSECYEADECASGFCNDETNACSDPPEPGGPCVGYDCGAAHTCVNGECVERAGPLEPCQGYDGCMYPYICLEGRCELFPLTCEPAPVGDRCAALRVCEDDGYCDFTANITCTERKGRGESCAGFPEEECGDGLFCGGNAGTPECAPRASVGGACDASRPCVESAVCVDLVCVEVPGGRQPCDWIEDCPAGTYCEDREEVCVPMRTEGQSCDEYDAPCAAGLICDDANVCAPLPPAGSPCVDSQCALDAWCNSSTCEARADEGDACVDTYDGFGSSCTMGLLCESSLCVPKYENGASCYEDESCASGVCDRRVYLCVDSDQCVD